MSGLCLMSVGDVVAADQAVALETHGAVGLCGQNPMSRTSNSTLAPRVQPVSG
jgi:hypothetical protein